MLYVQHYPDGGSITGLLDLVRSLDRARIRPIVAFLTPNVFLAEFEALGVAVHVLTNPVGGAPIAEPDPVELQRAGATPVRRRRWGAGRSQLRPVLSRLVRRDWPAAKALRRIIRAEGVDLIHANNDVLSNRDAVIASVLTRTPLVVHVRWLHVYTHDASWALDFLLARRARRVIFMSRAIARSCRPLHIAAPRQVVLDDPFEPGDFAVDESPRLRTELGLDPSSRVVLHIARIVPWKGQHVLVEAMEEVLVTEPAAVAVFVGAPTDADGREYGERLRRMAAESGLEDRVVFAGVRRDVPALLALADVVVHSSTTAEPFGRVVVEAMASGRPIVAADEGGVPEIVEHGRTGLLIPPRDSHALAAALISLLADPASAAAIGRRAQAEVRRRFSLERHGDALARIYGEVLGP